MLQLFLIFDSTLFIGLSYSFVAMGLALSLRVLDFPDLTIDGSFALGGAVSALCIVLGIYPWVALALGIFAGFSAGMITGILHTVIKISKLLSGILMMMILYSVNLAIMGRSNTPLLGYSTILSLFEQLDLSLKQSFYPDVVFTFHPLVIGFFFLLVFTVKLFLDALLKTEVGLRLRAIGNSEQFARSMGIHTKKHVILGLGLANGIVGLSGGLVAQNQGFADVGMGIGMIIVALAAIIIGETMLAGLRDRLGAIGFSTFSAILGTVVYQFIVVVCLRLGLPPIYLKMATGILVVVALSIRFRIRTDWRSKEIYAK